MALTLDEVRALSDVEVRARYDKVAVSTVDSLNFWRDEARRRDQEKATRAMTRLTRWIMALTAVMTVATVVNAILFALSM
jgi:hypothetical protein